MPNNYNWLMVFFPFDSVFLFSLWFFCEHTTQFYEIVLFSVLCRYSLFSFLLFLLSLSSLLWNYVYYFVFVAQIMPLRCICWNAVKSKSGHVVAIFPRFQKHTTNCSSMFTCCSAFRDHCLFKYFVNNSKLANYFDVNF